MKSFLEIIEDQLVANRLPLAGVTIAATPYANTPVVVNLHWHAFVEVKLAPESTVVAHQPVPSSALQVSSLWERFQDLENDALEAAWELGAWNLARVEARPYARPAAAHQERIECMTAFGVSPHDIEGEPVVVSEVPDAEELLDVAARAGYVCWQFRPVWCGLWKDVACDETLEPGGYRNPHCPVVGESYLPGRARTVVYQLGRAPTPVRCAAQAG
ncbi:MAG: diguanylate cyclase [Burkholderiales bacterium]|nr:diguanylate cyclase [Burkholderiales bacterium]